MIYADEEFYQKEYLSWREPVIRAGFSFYARQASQIIDQYTFGRLKGLPEIAEEVKMCCCELAEVEYQREKRKKESGGKTSERIGTYSVSFASVKETAEMTADENRDITYKWLADTGLCYRGVD